MKYIKKCTGYVIKPPWVTHQYKLISKEKGTYFELYDLISGNKQERTVIDSNGSIANQIQSELGARLYSVDNSMKELGYK